jgi:glycosyltransferase involved in cell wall biosynthesis
MNKPLISVILPVYNMGELVAGAIDSILSQTAINFELIVLNDGSTDNTADVLAAYAQRDERVVIVTNDHNLGLIRTLNIGLDRARGDYIARQDADNRSFSDRLSLQAAYLDEHADVGLVGMPVAVVTDLQQTDS